MSRNLSVLTVGFLLTASCGVEPTPTDVSVNMVDSDIASKSSALWLDEQQLTVNAGATDYIVWEPGQKGSPHLIKYCNQSNIYQGGAMVSYWQRVGDASWTKFSTDEVFSRCYEEQLWTGSADIRYKFEFTAYGQRTTFHWQFYRAWW